MRTHTEKAIQRHLKGNVLEYRERAIYKHETPDDYHAKAKYYYDEYREVTE